MSKKGTDLFSAYANRKRSICFISYHYGIKRYLNTIQTPAGDVCKIM